MQRDGISVHEHVHTSFRKGQGALHTQFLQVIQRFNAAGRYPLVFALSMLIGSAWYFSVWNEPPLVTIVAVFTVMLALFTWCRSRGASAILFIISVTGLGIASGALSGKFATLRSTHSVVEQPVGPVMLEGWVEDVQPAKRGVRLRLLVHAIDGVGSAKTPRHIRLTHMTNLKVEAGRFVRCWAVVRPPPGPVLRNDYAFDRQAWYERLSGVGYVQGRCRGGTLGQPTKKLDQFNLWVAKQRRSLAHYVNGVAGERAGGFAAALTSGDRSFMDARDQEALRGSGLAHLLAISGLHMGIVGGLVFFMVWRALALIEPLALRYTVRKPAAMAALMASLAYLVVSGASVSTQRAFIMALALFGAVIFDRAALSLRSLSIAMIAVIILAPWSVLTPGFQMSFAATGVLISSYEAWQRRQRETQGKPRRGAVFWMKSLVVTSTVSSLATMPFALYHFDRVAGMGLIANLFAMPIISLLSAPFAGAAMVLAPLGLSEYPLRAFGASLEAVLWVAHTFSDEAAGGTRFGKAMPAASLCFFAAALVGACVFKGVRARLSVAMAGTVIGASIWGLGSSAAIHWAPSGEVFLVNAGGNVERVAVLKGDGLAPLRFSDMSVSSTCENSECVRKVSGRTILISTSANMRCDALDGVDVLLRAVPNSCTIPETLTVMEWGDVQIENGVTLNIKRNASQKHIKPPCDRRPWRLCSN